MGPSVRILILIYLVYLGAQGQVISESDDVTLCEGGSTSFTCVLDSSISSDGVQWYRLLKDTDTTEMAVPQGSNIHLTTSTINNTLTTNLTITNAIKSYTGYYWVRLPSDDVCNVSLTVTTGPSPLTVNITRNTESSSIVVQWDEVDDSLPTTYTVTWTSERDLNNVQTKNVEEQSSYTITGLTLDTVYTITVTAGNECGTGPEYSTSVSLTTDTTSATSSITPNTTSTNPVMPTIDPTTTTAASASMATATDVMMSSITISSTTTTDSTTSSTANIGVTVVTTGDVISSIVSATTEGPSIISTPTTLVATTAAATTTKATTNVVSSVAASTTVITSSSIINTTTTTGATSAVSAAATTKTTTVTTTTNTTTTSTVVSPTSIARPADMTTADTTAAADESSDCTEPSDNTGISSVVVAVMVTFIVSVTATAIITFIVAYVCVKRTFEKANNTHNPNDPMPQEKVLYEQVCIPSKTVTKNDLELQPNPAYGTSCKIVMDTNPAYESCK